MELLHAQWLAVEFALSSRVLSLLVSVTSFRSYLPVSTPAHTRQPLQQFSGLDRWGWLRFAKPKVLPMLLEMSRWVTEWPVRYRSVCALSQDVSQDVSQMFSRCFPDVFQDGPCSFRGQPR